jgi:hypothetical protein
MYFNTCTVIYCKIIFSLILNSFHQLSIFKMFLLRHNLGAAQKSNVQIIVYIRRFQFADLTITTFVVDCLVVLSNLHTRNFF